MTTNDTQDPLIDDQNSNLNDENNSSSAINSQESEIIILNGASISNTSESSILDEDSTTSTDNTSESNENTIQPRDSQIPSAATIVFPTYNVSTTTTGASWATLNNATQSGYAIKYNGGANYGTDGNYQFYIGESAGTNAGNAIYDTQSRNFAITGNAGVHLGRGNIFIVGSTIAANLTIATPTTAAKKTSASLTLASGSYLSVNGYLGATTSTSVAGFVSAADQVSIKVVSSFFTVGPTTGTIINPKFGNNNVMEIGGTFGVYQNASANIGSNFTLSAGALEVGANNGNITIDNNDFLVQDCY
ncbi:hypothetical protein [Commensalibacter papalotli (ex Botero et al. 2024)]|uniref:MBG domain-containing protein n=1 Tax=Commensalibacter papalotli (ex Botero et al. 2024) TaxID=2972766 RepID=A0ABM9HMN9_9PROT|nr:hypothetical protein [Commensalibacter papalotli (ex Botero et al. 2024)]CAI3935961.1 unnamed protein product [Commensalibacter papalotli (ex Botero et al. 2024)]CAI3939688.1 unnamed protein product [Commensalibacter papalotli (ex Botero et al. 2024)]